jgi:hypothetical protein
LLRTAARREKTRDEVFMPTVRFSEKDWPESAKEFTSTLQEARYATAPIDDFVQLIRELTLLEQKHGLSSADFYERYQRGAMGDEMELMRWATKFEIYEEMKADLDNTFSLLERYALPAPA